MHGQRTRNGGALLLSAGKLCGVGMALVGDTYLGQQLFSHRNGLCLALTQDATRGFDDVIEHAHVRPQVEILEHEADLAAQAIDLSVIGGNQVAVARSLELQFFAGHQNLALMRVFQQVDAAQQRGLAGTGGAEDRYDVAVTSRQRDTFEHLQLIVALVQVADFQGGRGLDHVGSSLKCARWLPANVRLAKLKDNHRRLASSVEALDGLSHLGSGRSQEG